MAWPAWKFGMKRDDLNTTLHDKYNTLTLPIQDPEAFHHDVYELSQQAASADEFHGLMAERQQQRIRELTQSMESMAVEIIANPALIGTEQWQHALQLFRCKSYDSIVRYFSSYLPEGYFEKNAASSTDSYPTTDVEGDVEEDAPVQPCNTTKAADAVDDTPLYLDDDDFFPHGPVMTIKTDAIALEAEPLSPPHSEGSPSDESDSTSFSSSGSPSRSMSFSGSESGQLPAFMLHSMTDDTASQSDSGETVATSLYDSVESVGSFDDDDDILCTTQRSEDYFDFVDSVASPMSLSDFTDSGSDDNTPTPRAESRPAVSSLEREKEQQETTYDRAGRKFAMQLKRSTSPPSYVRSRADGLTSAKLRRGPDLASNKIHKCPTYDLRKRMVKSGRRKMMNVD